MCEFTQREYSCGHVKFIAARWCNLYKRTHRRCQPDIAHFEYRAGEICGQCRPHEVPEWKHRIKQNKPLSATGIVSINSLASPSSLSSLAGSDSADSSAGKKNAVRTSKAPRT